MPRLLILPLVLLLGSACSTPGPAPTRVGSSTTLREFVKSNGGDRRVFLHYDAKAESRWNPGWPGQFDLTGVAWDDSRTLTAITPRHVVMAAHYVRKPGETAVFHDRQGKPHSRTLLETTRLPLTGNSPDIAVGLLDRPLPPEIRPFPLPAPLDDSVLASSLPGALLLVTDQNRNLYFHQARACSGHALLLGYDPRLNESAGKNLISGDSGNPSFALVRGEPVLMETHTGGGAGSGPYYGSHKIAAALDQAVSGLDPAFRIRRVALGSAFLEEARANRPGLPATPAPAPNGGVSPSPPVPLPASPGAGRPRSRVVAPGDH